MEFKTTKHQVARGAIPDWEDQERFLLIKRVSDLRATYQIRLLTYRAVKEKKKLVIEVPNGCKIHDDLKALSKEHRRNITIVRD